MKPSFRPSDPQLRNLFLNALEITDPAQRRQFLDSACAGDDGLRAHVDALLASHEDDSFLEHPAVLSETAPSPTMASAQTVTAASPCEQMVPKNIRYFGDYEVLGELARGGMGVVYRARQKSLNRIVALKMIRTGRLADDAEVRRFRTEAEAAANLQHPNIVAIHEIGEHEGQHYFSMDYVEGKDLAQVAAGGPLLTAQAARYVKTIAETIAYAHQQGTLHRDLKPHNVLIDQLDQPRITDFGLAKIAKHDSALTQEGAVMGSPSYMPPEQASGKMSQIGPHSDVYSIGAVLYHLLTGRAPHVGETAVATLRLVLEEEPQPPTKLNPKVPEDLETICLKCLQKAPSHRYATARELVEELDRFLNFEPILARPASGWRRGWSWAQNNPWILAGVFASLGLLLACVAYGMFERARYINWHLTTRLERVQEVADSPSILFFQIFPLVMAALYLGGKVLRRNFQQRGVGGEAPSSSHLWLHVGCGVTGVVTGIAAIGLQIRSWAWSSSVSPMLIMEILSVLCASVLSGLGFHRAWAAAGLHETSRFRGVVERQLAVEWRRWSPFQLVCFAFWLLAVIWCVTILTLVCGALSKSPLGVFFALLALCLCVGLIKLTTWVIRERRRLFTFLFAPIELAAFLFALGALAVGSIESQPLNAHPKLVFAAFLASVVAGGILSIGWLFFRGSNQTNPQGQDRFPVNPWIDALLGAVLLFTLLSVLHVEENWRGSREWMRVKSELEAKGESVDFDSFLKPPVPKADNVMTHPFMMRHFLRGTPRVPIVAPDGMPTTLAALQKLSPDVRREADLTVEGNSAGTRTLEDLLRGYERFALEFELLEQALRRPHSRVDGDPNNLGAMPIPNFTSFGTTAIAYENRCKIHLVLGQADAAMNDLRMQFRLTDAILFNEPPPLAAMLWKAKLAGNCATLVEETLAANLWPKDQLPEIQKLASSLDLISDVSRSLRFGERAGGLRWIETFGKEFQFGDTPAHMSMIPKGWIDQERAVFARLFQNGLEGLNVPRRWMDPNVIHRADVTLDKMRGGSPSPFGMMASLMIPRSFVFVHHTTARSQTLLDQASLACALEQFRVSHGQYPESLDALIPQFMNADVVPHDRLNGRSYRYRRSTDGRYLLYSIGWNSIDDGGILEAPKAGQPQAEWNDVRGDWVWQGMPTP